MSFDIKTRNSFRCAAWIYLAIAAFMLFMTSRGLLSLLAEFATRAPELFGWLDLLLTLLPFLLLTYFGMKTPEEEVRDIVEKNTKRARDGD